MITQIRRLRREQAVDGDRQPAATSEPTISTRAEAADPEASARRRTSCAMAPIADTKVMHARLERRQPEAELEHQRQQEGHGADADAETARRR